VRASLADASARRPYRASLVPARALTPSVVSFAHLEVALQDRAGDAPGCGSGNACRSRSTPGRRDRSCRRGRWLGCPAHHGRWRRAWRGGRVRAPRIRGGRGRGCRGRSARAGSRRDRAKRCRGARRDTHSEGSRCGGRTQGRRDLATGGQGRGGNRRRSWLSEPFSASSVNSVVQVRAQAWCWSGLIQKIALPNQRTMPMLSST